MDSLRICLFCNKASEGIKASLDHMKYAHSFIILDIDCLISLKALLYYLSEKIHSNNSCVFCHQNFASAEATQNHMVDKWHCFMNSDDFDIEFEPFYDFSGTYAEDFEGKNLEDFDLNHEGPGEEPQTETEEKAEGEKTEGKIPKGDFADDDWEDVDMVDGKEPAPKEISKEEEDDTIDADRMEALESISSQLNVKEKELFLSK